ncbi:ShlB/FhaC/HecB family hemolysin secretion/activation protein [Massilia arenosa]|uniref:ShlB/FhaC/HecB family hemolysin secretion/activation protein n=1 Tax=Zemynaea arenosa TaxID=2561931 RepID=A0A4Y9S7P6_9BURK|nr:ShlB/FhaC/HecB family hemolysin secretion/activation protein [Massilia arenosa]TFW16073.1 ShlB/FhaC/HecB family hemolysin secretion/activation protein [Massilia arenosa]
MRLPFARLLAGSVLAAAVSAAWAQTAPAAQDAAAAPGMPDVPRFAITRFDVTGNTLLPQADVDAAVAPYAGAERDFGDVQRALEALEAVYHARGYNVVSVRLPEQELNGGVVRLVVVQTKIGKINVRDNKYFDATNIRRSVPALQEGQTPNLDRVSAQLKAANENPSKKITLRLAGGQADDEVDANIDVADQKPWRAMLNLDNTGTGETGRTHVTAALQHANLFGRDHVGSLQYTTTAQKPDQVSVWGAGYHIPLYELGDSVDLFANYSNVDSGVVAAGIFNLAVSGRGTVYGGRYNHTLAKRGTYESSLIYGFDWKAYRSTVLLGTSNFGNDITVHPLSVTYTGNQPLDGGEAAFSASLVKNVSGGDKGDSAAFAASRAGAKASYTLVRLAGNLTRRTASDWLLRAIANAQLSGDALVSGEQFGAGGSASVRGFEERELAGDSGLNTNLEAWTPELCGSTGKWQCRGLGFYDAAYVRRNHALAGELTSTTIGSVGLGLRMSYGTSMNLQVDWGHAVQHGALPGGNRVHVRVGFAY